MTHRPAPDSRPSPHAHHPRRHRDNLYVYPVVSRRSGGISLGINLNRDQYCNFRCLYCQVDRTQPPQSAAIDLERLAVELETTARAALAGELFAAAKEPGDATAGPPGKPAPRLRDIAFSGDGEPTAHPQFGEAVRVAAEVRRRLGLDDVRLVVITNATLLDTPRVLSALETLDAADGVLWCKLDAGDEAGYRRIARSQVPWQRILDNLRMTSRQRPIIIQSLFMRIDGAPPRPEAIEAYCRRLIELREGGGQIELVQVHTVARPPAEANVAALRPAEVDAIAATVRGRTGLPVAAFYGSA